ncbi:MAG: hypothetical protein AAB569_03240 [Patescibacteria group bacterium]
MKLTKIQSDKLWGEDGPYSEVHLIIETRILDDKEARKFIIVEQNINPLSFEILKKNSDKFKNDIPIMQLFEHAEYRGQKFGYVVCAFIKEYRESSDLIEGQECVDFSKEMLIRIHKFVMNYLGI